MAIADSTTPSTSPAAKAQSGGPKRTASAATSPFSPSSVPVFGVDRLARGRGHRGEHRDRPDQRERERDEQLDRNADDARALPVVGDRPQRAAVARALEEPSRAERERDRQAGDEERARLHLRAAEVDVPAVPTRWKGSGSGKT